MWVWQDKATGVWFWRDYSWHKYGPYDTEQEATMDFDYYLEHRECRQ